jgi:3-oxoacyl-[acyl-carrier-protein] synthase II
VSGRAVAISAWGFADAKGFGGSRRSGAFSLDPIRWAEVSGEPCPRFGRLDPPCKLALIATELLGLAVSPDRVHADVGVTLGTRYGCLQTDAAFYRTLGQPEGASPMLFSYTLPSTLIAEVSIRFRLGGPNACFMAGEESGLVALWEGVRLVRRGEAGACVCIGCDAVEPGPYCPEGAWGASAFLVESPEHAEACGRAPLAEVRATPLPDGFVPSPAEQSLVALREWLAQNRRNTLALACPRALGRSEVLVAVNA